MSSRPQSAPQFLTGTGLLPSGEYDPRAVLIKTEHAFLERQIGVVWKDESRELRLCLTVEGGVPRRDKQQGPDPFPLQAWGLILRYTGDLPAMEDVVAGDVSVRASCAWIGKDAEGRKERMILSGIYIESCVVIHRVQNRRGISVNL